MSSESFWTFVHAFSDFAGAFSWRVGVRFSSVAPHTNSTRNASPQPALPPGPGLAALLLPNVRAHAHGRPSQQESRAITQNFSNVLDKSHYRTRCSSKRDARGPVRASTGAGSVQKRTLCCNSP
eukprot:scaffold107006_cov66-Phaeocystis_antarctica.AAC.2